VANSAVLKVKSIILKAESIFSDWTSSIDLTKTRVVKSPSYIFLCGGKISENENNFHSCRDIFYSYIKKNNCSYSSDIVLAEDVIKYFENSIYEDLLSFEKDLASLSALTVIFSESPGAIAELGSFSVLENIQERLLIVIHSDHSFDQDSFIWRGPISFLKNIAEKNGNYDPVVVYKWRMINPADTVTGLTFDDFSDASDLSYTIASIINKRDKTNLLKKDHIGHVMLLIASVLNVIQISTAEEIFFILNSLGFNKCLKDIKKYLSLLVSLKILAIAPYRNYKFYVATRPHTNWFKWSYHTSNDTTRWTSKFVDFYEKNEQEKSRALRSNYKSI
jgi:hypothetical protein